MSDDKRAEIVERFSVWAVRHGFDGREAKNDAYLMLADVEIIGRSTAIAECSEDHNENLVKRFILAKQVKGCTSRTLRAYATGIPRIIEKIGKTVENITADDIRYYMAFRLRKDGVSKTTIQNETRYLSSFFGWLYQEELIRKNPMLKIDSIRPKKEKKDALTELEIEKLRAAARDSRETMIIEVLLSTGSRVTEFVNILLTDIDEDRILVHGKGEKDRYVYLNAKARFALEKYLADRKDCNPYLMPRGASVAGEEGRGMRIQRHDWWKFPENIREGHSANSSIETIMRKLARRAGVTQANPHKLRRTCATMALRHGMPLVQVSQMLGHASVGTTQIYLDVSEDELKMAHKKYVI